VAKTEIGLSKLNVTSPLVSNHIRGMPVGKPYRSTPWFVRLNRPPVETAAVTVVEPETDDTGPAGLGKTCPCGPSGVQVMLSCRDDVAVLGVSWPVEITCRARERSTEGACSAEVICSAASKARGRQVRRMAADRPAVKPSLLKHVEHDIE
jgi:hypothetical protein